MMQIVHRTFEGFIDTYAALRGQGSKVKLLYFTEVAGKVPALEGLDAVKGRLFIVSFRTPEAVHICYAATNDVRERFALQGNWGIIMSANGYFPLPGLAKGAWPISQDAKVEE